MTTKQTKPTLSERADAIAESWINGNHEWVRAEILRQRSKQDAVVLAIDVYAKLRDYYHLEAFAFARRMAMDR